MEKNKVGTSKTPCICVEDSVESLNDASVTATVNTDEDESSEILDKTKICPCTYDGQVKVPNRVSWVDGEDHQPKCVCEIDNAFGPVFDDIPSTTVLDPGPTAPAEEPKKKRTFVQTLKYLVTCACLRKKSEELKPEPEPEPELEDADTSDSGIISLLGRTYSEVSTGKDDWKRKPIILEYDVPDDMPEDVTPEIPTKVKTKPVTPEKPTKVKTKPVTPEKPTKLKTKPVTKEIPTKAKTKPVTPKVSFGKTLPKKKESVKCICTEDSLPKYGAKSRSRISTTASKVKCKCTDPEETPSGHLIVTKCVCGQLTASQASLASGYTIGSRGSKPDCCYPEKSEKLIRKIDYQRPSQYSYSQYDEPLQTYGREAPSIRSVYTPSVRSSAMSFTDSSRYLPEEDDMSQNSQLNDPGSKYSYRKSTSVIPSCCVSETAAGPSKPATLYQRLVKRFWLESVLYRDPYEQPSVPQRVQSAPSYVTNTAALRRPSLKYKTDSKVKKPATKSKEKVCRCSKTQLVAVPSKKSKEKTNVEKSKSEQSQAENLEPCLCLKKPSETVSKRSKEKLKAKECHCLELLYMSKSPSKTEEKVLSKAPSDVSAATAKDESKESKNTPTTIVTPPEETEAKPADGNGSKSSSNSSVVTVIDTHALEVPRVSDTGKEARPVEVKKSTETQEQPASGSSPENPEEAPPPLGNDTSGWWDKSKHLIIGSTVVGATAIGAYQYFKE